MNISSKLKGCRWEESHQASELAWLIHFARKRVAGDPDREVLISLAEEYWWDYITAREFVRIALDGLEEG